MKKKRNKRKLAVKDLMEVAPITGFEDHTPAPQFVVAMTTEEKALTSGPFSALLNDAYKKRKAARKKARKNK